MELTPAFAVISFLSGGVGAYLGAYLRKKAENRAIHEDINKLVDQVSAVTTATKQIESKISGDLWDRQKQWELKREIMLDAGKKLSAIGDKLRSLHTFWRKKWFGQIEGEEALTTLEHRYVHEWQECIRSFEETESLIYVTCSKETMTAFAELGDLLRKTASDIVSNDFVAYDETESDRDKKFARARVAIRTELGVVFELPSASKHIAGKA